MLTRYDRKSGENVDIQPQPAAGEPPLSLELGLAAAALPALADPALLRRQQALPQRRPRRQLEGRLARPHPPARPQPAEGVRTGPEAPTPWRATPRPRSTATSSRSTSRRASRACSTSAPTTAWSRSRRTAAPTGARSTASRACPTATYVSRPARLAARRRRRLRRLRQPQDGRLQALRPASSADRGRTWTSIAADLPERGTVYALAEDPVAARPALRRHRVRPLRHPRRRRRLGRAQRRPADDSGPRPRDPEARGRPRRRHLRPRLLRPRRPHAAARRCRRPRSSSRA